MSEDEVMNYLFKLLRNTQIEMVHAEHDNNQIMFTPNQKERWLMTITKVE